MAVDPFHQLPHGGALFRRIYNTDSMTSTNIFPSTLRLGLIKPDGYYFTKCAVRDETILPTANCPYTGFTAGSIGSLLWHNKIPFSLHLFPNLSDWGSLSQTKPTGAIALIEQGIIDTVPVPYAVTSFDNPKFIYSQPVNHYLFYAVFKTTYGELGAESLRRVFGWQSWLGILFSILLTVVLISADVYLKSKYQFGGYDLEFFKTFEISKTHRRNRLLASIQHGLDEVFTIITSVDYQGESYEKWSIPKRISKSLMSLFLVVIFSQFQSSLLNLLLSKTKVFPVTSMRDLIDRVEAGEVKLVSYKSFKFVVEEIRHSESPHMIELRNAIRKTNGMITLNRRGEAMKMLLKHPNYVVVVADTKAGMEYLTIKYCGLSTVYLKGAHHSAISYVFHANNTGIRTLMSSMIYANIETYSALLNRFSRFYLWKSKKRHKLCPGDPLYVPVQVHNVALLLYGLALGGAVSFVVVFIEGYYRCRRQPTAKNPDDNIWKAHENWGFNSNNRRNLLENDGGRETAGHRVVGFHDTDSFVYY